MDERRFLSGNRILIFLCILLFAGLVLFIRWNDRQEQEAVRQLQQGTDGSEQDVSESQETDAKVSRDNAENETPDHGLEASTDAADETEAASAVEETAGQTVEDMIGISFRGDSFESEERIEENGFGTRMREVLAEQNLDIPVVDYTMYQAGSMSQMKLAGVEQTVLDGYVESHKANLSEDQLRITEVKIRDLTPEELIRDDQNYIPVLCMGYYGGWGYNLDELCEQQQKVLDTYQQKEKYLILGVYPTGYSDREGYTRKMQETWGEHYLAVDGVAKHSISTDEGKRDTAQLVFDKMQELGYLS